MISPPRGCSSCSNQNPVAPRSGHYAQSSREPGFLSSPLLSSPALPPTLPTQFASSGPLTAVIFSSDRGFLFTVPCLKPGVTSRAVGLHVVIIALVGTVVFIPSGLPHSVDHLVHFTLGQ